VGGSPGNAQGAEGQILISGIDSEGEEVGIRALGLEARRV
jgi:hypothetical protein